ncbi:MAG: GNAT family N-acetyltransferase [Pseudomonadota bacterium]
MANPKPVTLTIRPAADADLPALAALCVETNRHYYGPINGDEEMSSATAAALIQGRSGCTALLALEGEAAIAFATFTIVHLAPNANGTLFLKELFVSKRARGTGVGEQVMRHLARMAVEMGCARFDWTAETDNPRAMAFYDRLGAPRVEEKVYYRLTGTDLSTFAKGDQP